MYAYMFGEDPIFGVGLWVYYRGLNDYQNHFEVDLRYHLLQLYKEYGTVRLICLRPQYYALFTPRCHLGCRGYGNVLSPCCMSDPVWGFEFRDLGLSLGI